VEVSSLSLPIFLFRENENYGSADGRMDDRKVKSRNPGGGGKGSARREAVVMQSVFFFQNLGHFILLAFGPGCSLLILNKRFSISTNRVQ
jgi:hypothetical protein